jgi:hypothetical protein
VPLLFSPEVPTPTYLQEKVLSQGACHKQDLKKNEPQIIHCDRLKRKVKQKLRGESERDTDPVEIDREEVVEDIRPEVGTRVRFEMI